MTFLCLWASESIPPVPLLTVVPRVVADGNIVWADVHGLPARETVYRIRRALPTQVVATMRAGLAATPIAAEVAATHLAQVMTVVPDGGDRSFLAPFPVSVLCPDRTLANLLDGAGVETCGELARLSRESVEVRFGADGARVWRLARADDARRIFTPVPRPFPVASLEWTDYTLRRAERLVFVINGLCGNVCEVLRARGQGAIAMTMVFALANRTAVEFPVRAARATAGHTAWMRLLRLELEQIVLPDAVSGITLRVDAVGGLGGTQGDVFDRGFGTAQAAETAVSDLLDDHGAIVVEPENTSHPLLERRTNWTSRSATQTIQAASHASIEAVTPALTLQLLPKPLRITVATIDRRGAPVPRSYRNGQETHKILEAAGPDRVSGGQWEVAYAREYFRCVTDDGALVWIYRDVRTNIWYLHGWWD